LTVDESDLIGIADNILQSIFGEIATRLLYDYIEREFHLSRLQILQEPSKFIEALVATFGETGAKMIEKGILKAVEAKVSYDKEENPLTLTQVEEYAWRLRRCIDFLSEYEAKLFIALIAYGESSARKLAKNTGIPRTKIYHTAENLQTKDMASSRRFRGMTLFKPKNPIKVFRGHINLMRKKLMDLEMIVKKLHELYQNLSLPEELDSLEELKQR